MDKIGFIGGKFLPPHLGHIYAIKTALSHVDHLYVVITASEQRDRITCKKLNFPYVSIERRLMWLGNSLSDLGEITLLHVEDGGVYDYDWDKGTELIKKAIGSPITHVFSSEPKYHDNFTRLYPDAKHVLINPERKSVPISAIQIRQDLYKHWKYLPNAVKAYFVKKVVVVGTESCGKSILVQKLAKLYNTNCVQEVGRVYCEKFMNRFTPEMFDEIAMKHYLEQLESAHQSNKFLFVDTEAIVTQYYLHLYSNKHSDFLDVLSKKQSYDLWLYLEPDVEWVEDGYRFAGGKEERIKNNEFLKDMFSTRGIKFHSIDGNYDVRLNKCVSLIDELLG